MTASLAFPASYEEAPEEDPAAEPMPQWGNVGPEFLLTQFIAVKERLLAVSTLNRDGQRAIDKPLKNVEKMILRLDGPFPSEAERQAFCTAVDREVKRAKKALRSVFQKDAHGELGRAHTDAQTAFQAALNPEPEEQRPTYLAVVPDPRRRRDRRGKRSKKGKRSGRR